MQVPGGLADWGHCKGRSWAVILTGGWREIVMIDCAVAMKMGRRGGKPRPDRQCLETDSASPSKPTTPVLPFDAGAFESRT